jgi:beta-mannosidase
MNAPFSAYRTFDSRFMSEYGFESFPAMKTLRTICPPEQLDFFSPVMENHQKNAAGNKKIMDYMARRFSIPEDFESQVILSQITQAEAVEYGIEHWRRNRNDQHCMGSLYWQLNDCWQVASWASLDYYGRWKALHYFARRAHEPFCASVREEIDRVEFWVMNDERHLREGILHWWILGADGSPVLEGKKETRVQPCSACHVHTQGMEAYQEKLKEMVVFFRLDGGDGTPVMHGFRLFDAPQHFPLQDPSLDVQVEEGKHGELYRMTVKASHTALYVNIESEEVDFIASDNYFSMMPGEVRQITLEINHTHDPAVKPGGGDIARTFRVRSLYELLNR